VPDLLPDPANAADPAADPAARPPKRKHRRLLPLVVDAKRLAPLLCGSVRWIRALNTAGKLPAPLRIGGRVLWEVLTIRAWIAAGAPDRETWEEMTAARR
jgi:prophage regulatory protein